MGTSSARRGPSTGLWRAAKAAATRYLSPEAGAAVSAQEVVARYLTALAETPGRGDQLTPWRFTRKAAQDLGAFWDEVQTRGWDATLAARGLAASASGPPEMPVFEVSAFLAGSGGGLEDAVVRTALTLALREAVISEPGPDAAQLVRRFLATAVRLRLALDLGESLEAAASGCGGLQDGLSQIEACIEAGATAARTTTPPPATPERWQGLTGWTWVSEMMTSLLHHLGE